MTKYNVLSLFDGMSAGRVAFDRAGISVGNYYASEIDKYAIKVSGNNHSDIIQVGDVTKLDDVYLKSLNIDILIGGSPCQSFSSAGNGLGFTGSSGLFWEYVRILKLVKPKYFLLENVTMKKEWVDIISAAVGCEPIVINSSLVSAQHRNRLYWTNIPDVVAPVDTEACIADIIEHSIIDTRFDLSIKPSVICNVKRDDVDIQASDKDFYVMKCKSGYQDNKVGLIKTPCLRAGNNATYIYDGHSYRKLTPVEWERLQTFSDGYTEGVSNTQRYKMLGNGWTVDIISHIFKGIK